MKAIKIDLSKLKPKGILHIKKFKVKKRFIFLGVIIIVVAALILKNILIPKQVMVTNYTPLAKGKIVNSVDATGTVESEKITNVYSKASGNLVTVNFKAGDEVKKGDILAVVDSEKLQREINQDAAAIEQEKKQSKADLQSKKRVYDNVLYKHNNSINDEISSAETELQAKSVALEEAQKTYDYNKELFNYGEVSEKDLRKSDTDYQAAKKQYDQALIALESAKNSEKDKIDEAKEGLDSAIIKANDKSKEVELKNKEVELQECVIKSPVSGTITAANAQEGQAAEGTLFTIEDINDVYIEVPIKEVDILNVKKGQKVEVKTDAMDDNKSVEGVVTSVTKTAEKEISQSSSSDSSSNNNRGASTTSTFKAKIKLKQANSEIKVGMSAKAKIIINEATDIYTVPFDCLVDGEKGSSIYVAQPVDKGYVIKQIPVTTGLESDVNVEIKGKGLSNKAIVINNPSDYTVGEKVNVGPAQGGSQSGGEGSEK